MINRLILKNFKCFSDIELEFSGVNVLTGLNGMGKSTVMQSILLIAQSQKSIMSEQILLLKGKYVNLGTGQDVLYEKAEKDEISILVQIDQYKESFKVGYQSEMDVLPLEELNFDKNKIFFEEKMDALFYLSAYRIEPQFLYQIENEKDLEKRYFGKSGEYAIQYLKLHGGDEVENRRIIIGNKTTIFDQVKAWLDMVSPGVSPVININVSSRTAELQYEYIEDREKTNSYKSVNVGFGITYVLPVIVQLIAARPGDIILLENPEAHIHPRGQRMLGELMAAVGAGGVQIIMETHSDHILNGIRVAVKKGKVSPEETKVFYFYKDIEDEYRHKVMCPMLDRNGRFNEWPVGFFDEWDNAFLELL